ncbi:MAG: OmpA family protein [Gemmatimonadetes bacterium]|jgi:outer membrane protein OmpA-like peptidoglycan-associated protein|nr:OmpA family protein [Gemmatimonadota bacterium]MBT4611143.1 OmpA family protein [Gemmatimonadota bacterium]MBT5055154.1 OmpA family protein [Gemmatimonadota bacterium]MBT5962064.1 OmpA family protein [Gemmatimonadota bacterium]
MSMHPSSTALVSVFEAHRLRIGLIRLRVLAVVMCLLVTPCTAEFNPPRITQVIRSTSMDESLHHLGPPQYCVINRGTEIKMEKGDLLNIYRQKRIITRPLAPIQVFLGSMIVTSSYNGSSMGIFTPDPDAIQNPILRHRNIMEGDVAIPSLVLDSDVLFDPGQAQLKGSAQAEVAKVADFILYYNPPTLIIEGHTDSDGDELPNQDLSERRANALRQMLLDNHPAITPETIQSRGRGEERPIAPNDSPASKAMNRRLEVIVIWEVLEERAKSRGLGDDEEEEEEDLFTSR